MNCGPIIDRICWESDMPVFLEKFILPVLAVAIAYVIWVNPMRWGWRSRTALCIAVTSLAYLISHQLYLRQEAIGSRMKALPNSTSPAVSASSRTTSMASQLPTSPPTITDQQKSPSNTKPKASEKRDNGKLSNEKPATATSGNREIIAESGSAVSVEQQGGITAGTVILNNVKPIFPDLLSWQSKKLVEQLQSAKGETLGFLYYADVQTYADQIADCFAKAGWVLQKFQLGTGTPEVIGIAYQAKGHAEQIVLDAFKSAQIEIHSDPNMYTGPGSAQPPGGWNTVIFVGHPSK